MRGVALIGIALVLGGAACGGDGARDPSPYLLSRAHLEDSDVAGEVYGRMIDALAEAEDDEEAMLDRATRGQRIIYVLLSVEGEIDNGGFNQLFWNSAGEFAGEAIRDSDALGAKPQATLLRRAAAIFPDGVPHDRAARQNALAALPRALSEDRLDALSDEWYELKPIDAFLELYISRHHDEFFEQ